MAAVAGNSKPGFFAPDVHTALQQRAAWFEGLGDSVVFDSEIVESGSEQWDGEEKDMPRAEPGQKPTLTHKASALPGSLCDLLAAGFARVETEELDVQAARQRFRSAAKQEGVVTLRGRPEPAPARLNRLRKEVATLCDWAAAEQQGAGHADGQLQQLRKEVSEMGSTLKAQAESELKNLPQRLWLPPEQEDVSTAALLKRRDACEVAAGTSAGGVTGGASYSLTAPSGWLLRSQAELLPQLQARVDRLQQLLGSPDASEGEALRQQTERLSKRLQRLEELGGDACQRLLASMSLLSSQIEVAVGEAVQLEALEAEQEREELELSKPVSPTSKALAHEVDAAVETAETQVERLHEQLAALDGVATRVKEMEEQLSGGDAWRQRLEVFVQDLALAEARSAKACELLKSTAQAAASMKESSQAGKDQLQKDLGKLQAKLQKTVSKR